ncbi:hypothetical protein BSKO_10182 [Bryopsis sp. KO-2023]|nr:hypothetical protein BSKO_10182 [Bryopsis sp. KO-2023]
MAFGALPTALFRTPVVTFRRSTPRGVVCQLSKNSDEGKRRVAGKASREIQDEVFAQDLGGPLPLEEQGAADFGECLSEGEANGIGAETCHLLFDDGENSHGSFMPPSPMEGVATNPADYSVQDLCYLDEVYNQQLSWLSFNWRVMAMATEETTPLYERLLYLAIASKNLDEFFAKRVGGLMRQREAGVLNLKQPLNGRWTPQKQLQLISQEVKKFCEYHADVYRNQVLPKLRDRGIRILDYDDLNEDGRESLDKMFETEIELLLTPIKIDPGHPFPYLPSGSMNLAILLTDPSSQSSTMQCAIVNTPRSSQRWIRVPPNHAASGESWDQGFVAVENVIMRNMDQLFGGMVVLGAYAFRVIRNADFDRHEEEADDLLDMISDELRERRFAPFVRLEVDVSMPKDLTELLAFELSLDNDLDVYRVPSLVQTLGLLHLPVCRNELNPDLTFPQWSPSIHPRLVAPYKQKNLRRNLMWTGSRWKGIKSIFSVIRDGDILLHHPYHNFAASTQRFLDEAARDPDVVAIKSTLYRTSSRSPIIASLLKARETGKNVAVLVELKARFDEAQNVGIARKLEVAGCNVAYGLVGVKTHAKTTLVVRRERRAPNGFRTYVHIGTGNYNPDTARVYTDFGLLTCNPKICQDVVDLFKHLTGMHSQEAVGGYSKLLVASQYMKKQLLGFIDREIENAKAGKMAAVCIKVNGIDEEDMVAKLYEATAAGVRVDGIVRAICRLRPGVIGISENMRVVSIIGRFLEHHRVYCFYNDGDPLYFIGSADWMPRNLTRRVELAAPIECPRLKAQLKEFLALCLYDRVNSWEMLGNGRYVKPAFRTSEARLSAPLLGEEDCDVFQKRGGEVGCQDPATCENLANLDRQQELQ